MSPRRLALPSAVLGAVLTLLAGLAPVGPAFGGGSELLGFPSLSQAGGSDAVTCPPTPVAEVPMVAEVVFVDHEAPTPAPAPVPPRTPRAPRAMRINMSKGNPTGSTRTDTTITVQKGMKFDLQNFGGSVELGTWGQSSVRVRAAHSRRDWIEIASDLTRLEVVSRSRSGPSHAVDYEITTPSWMAVSLSGVYNDVHADGVKGGLSVETVSGDIKVRNAAGDIELRSVEGLVELAEANGRVILSSVNDGVNVLNVTGDVVAEAVNGNIRMLDLTSKAVEANTVNGAVLFDGKILDDGVYSFSSHNGDIALGLSQEANATVSVSSFAGDFESWFPVSLMKTKKGKRFSFILGSSKAKIDLESFQGTIQLFRPGAREFRARFLEDHDDGENDDPDAEPVEHEHEHEHKNDKDEDDK